MVKRTLWRRRWLWLVVPWSALGLVAGLLLALRGPGVAHAADVVVGGACGVTIQACINHPSVTAGDTVYVPPGVYTESVTISKSVSLRGLPDGAATTIIHAVSGQRVMTITSAVSQSITLSDLTITGGSAGGSGGGIRSVTNAPVFLYSLILSDNTTGILGAGAYISASGVVSNVTAISNTSVSNGGGLWGLHLTVSDSRFERNQCTGFCSGAGLFAQGALTLTNTIVQSNTSAYNGGGAGGVTSVLVTGGVFENNTSNTSGYGGGGLVAFGTADISGTQFISNSAYTYGGGLFGWLTTTLTNTVFISNSAVYTNARGGAVFVDDGALSIFGGEFAGNTSGDRGGALYSRVPASIIGAEFHHNTAVLNGGAAWIQSAVLEGGSIHDNACTGSCIGGGLAINALLTVSGTTFARNTSVSNGGAVWARSAQVSGATFSDNDCTGFCSGAGIWSDSVLTLTDTLFEGNTSAFNGGAAASVTHAEVRGGLFENNTSNASGYGGGGMVVFGTATLSGTQFISNSAYTYGGGLYSSYTTTLTNTVFMSNSTVLTTGIGGGATLLRAGHVSGGQFVGNQAGAAGGLYLGGVSSVENALFTGNLATNFNAGGLRADAGLTLTNVSLLNNQAAYCGGGAALFSSLAGAMVADSEITGNTVLYAGGGGICGGAPITMVNTLVMSNSALNGGGALFFINSAITGGLFQGNTAQTDGGAIDAWGPLTLTGTQMLSNQAARGGALRLLWGGQIVNSLLAANTATAGQGHGLFIEGVQPLTLLHTTIATPTVALGSAIAFSGTVQAGVTNTLISNYATGLVVLSGAAYADYNLYAGVTTPTLGVSGGAHNVFGLADFIAPLAGNYHLAELSLARDRAAPGTGVNDDFDGDARPYGPLPDIGYDEYTSGYRIYLPQVTYAEIPGR